MSRRAAAYVAFVAGVLLAATAPTAAVPASGPSGGSATTGTASAGSGPASLPASGGERGASGRPVGRRPVTMPAPARGGVWPLSPRPEVVGDFDPPASEYGPGHRGVDLAGRVGQTVRAALGGRIRFAGRVAGRGVVVVGHGALRTTYEPVEATVSVGDRVSRGDPIGVLQATGSHCRPAACLHWGLLRGETYLDPLTLVGLGPVRLLPFLG